MAEIRKGQLINDRFVVGDRCGSGGYGSVWRCQDQQLDREIAFKRLNRAYAGQDLSDELIEEARKISNIVNQNIVSVFDVIKHDDELLIVMEYLPLGSLHDRLRKLSKEGKWVSVTEAFGILRGVLDGLSAAHLNERGEIIHRDLKPENILFDSQMRPKIADFGLAAVGKVDPLTTGERRLGGHGGTQFYMSPEQMKGEALDARSDLFNVGLLAYLLLGASHPFVDPRNLFTFNEMVVSPYRALPPIKSTAMPTAVENFVFTLLSENPGDRFESALGARDELVEAEDAYNESFLQTVLEYHDALKTGGTKPEVLSAEDVSRGILLCKKNRFFAQGAYLYENSGASFSEMRTDIKQQVENDYSFCRRRAQQEVVD